MVVGTGVAASEGAILVLNVERLNEIDVLSCDEFEDVCDKACADIGLRHKHAHVFVEPVGVKSRAATGGAEGGLVYVVVNVAVDVVFLGQILDCKGRLYAADELVVLHVRHHAVLGGEFKGVLLHLLI